MAYGEIEMLMLLLIDFGIIETSLSFLSFLTAGSIGTDIESY